MKNVTYNLAQAKSSQKNTNLGIVAGIVAVIALVLIVFAIMFIIVVAIRVFGAHHQPQETPDTSAPSDKESPSVPVGDETLLKKQVTNLASQITKPPAPVSRSKTTPPVSKQPTSKTLPKQPTILTLKKIPHSTYR